MSALTETRDAKARRRVASRSREVADAASAFWIKHFGVVAALFRARVPSVAPSETSRSRRASCKLSAQRTREPRPRARRLRRRAA
jgi:hypothetical protein